MAYVLDYLKERFIHHCLNNDIVSAKKIYDKDLIDINQIECEITTPLDITDMFSLFECMCIKNYIEIVKWLITLNVKNEDYNFGFISACTYNNREILEYLYYNNKKLYYKNNNLDFNHAFMVCCFIGNFDILKWLYNTVKINIRACDDNAFIYALSQKHYDIAMWLYNLSVKENNIIDIRIDNDFAFKYSCYYGNLDICKWLYTISDNKIDKLNYIFIENANYSGNQELIRWLET